MTERYVPQISSNAHNDSNKDAHGVLRTYSLPSARNTVLDEFFRREVEFFGSLRGEHMVRTPRERTDVVFGRLNIFGDDENSYVRLGRFGDDVQLEVVTMSNEYILAAHNQEIFSPGEARIVAPVSGPIAPTEKQVRSLLLQANHVSNRLRLYSLRKPTSNAF